MVPILRKLKTDSINILLVDDDAEDYMIFKNALSFQVFKTSLERIIDGDMLMQRLHNEDLQLPDVIFLDVNMPGKNGYDCLLEIRESPRLENIQVVMYSTSYHKDVADILFKVGANYYVKKPSYFKDIKKIIEKVLCFVSENQFYSPVRQNFVFA